MRKFAHLFLFCANITPITSESESLTPDICLFSHPKNVMINNMKNDFAHPALNVQKDKPLVYTAMSKHLFYYRMFISVFVLENGGVPLNPFMVFDYFLLDAVDRDLVREGNNNLVKRCDEIWVFGAISNGVLAEIQIANEQSKTVRFFAIEKPHKIVETTKDKVEMEAEVSEMRHLL